MYQYKHARALMYNVLWKAQISQNVKIRYLSRQSAQAYQESLLTHATLRFLDIAYTFANNYVYIRQGLFYRGWSIMIKTKYETLHLNSTAARIILRIKKTNRISQ